MSTRRITQKDIAQAANVHPATVSLALRNHHSIPIETCRRIQKIAKELGYEPDPMLTALAKYRSKGIHEKAYKGVLAWFVNRSIPGYDWRDSPHYCRWFDGAKSQAQSHGYQLEVIEYSASQVRASRMANILRARNIQGILLCPQPEPFVCMDFFWDSFSVVAFGSTLVAPRFHTVAIAHYQAVREVFDTLWQRGYRRIGCAIPKTVDSRCDNVYLSAYLGKNYLHGNLDLPLLYQDFDEQINPHDLAQWCKSHRLDAVISNHYLVDKVLAAGGLPTPEKIAAACPSLSNKDSELSGIYENSFHIGEVAVDFLVDMVYRAERGIPRYPQRLNVEGIWHEGKTIAPARKKMPPVQK